MTLISERSIFAEDGTAYTRCEDCGGLIARRFATTVGNTVHDAIQILCPECLVTFAKLVVLDSNREAA